VEFDRVDCFGKISVRIPHSWAQGEGDDGTCEFFDPNGKTGTLRASLVTAQRDEGCTQETLQDEEFEIRHEPNANFFRVGSDRFAAEWNGPAKKEDGVHMFYWTVAAVINPKLIRKAVFSYTVINSRMREPDFSGELQIVRDCVLATYFMSEVVN
jgi:hypothetical protein